MHLKLALALNNKTSSTTITKHKMHIFTNVQVNILLMKCHEYARINNKNKRVHCINRRQKPLRTHW